LKERIDFLPAEPAEESGRMVNKVAELFVEVLAAAGVSIFSTMLMPLPQDICWAKLLTIPTAVGNLITNWHHYRLEICAT
jgi:hypothetical protein